MQLGVIADDFTGATDIASFLVRNGMPTVQLNGVPTRDIPLTSEAVVISLKTRSCPAEMAVSQSLAALRWLQAQGCQQFYFKYCSTFDSTAQGNIGPVLDALLLKMPAFEWVHVQLHQQKGMISLSPPTICNSAPETALLLTGTGAIPHPMPRPGAGCHSAQGQGPAESCFSRTHCPRPECYGHE
ncbi:four-carbon acid sugar kinase family protein [Klebsiella pneumoniae]|uniref:four-carbon acid sugar kinase family protein n=1 Tax=Klebsiella pneumoniae TaxID=573 RepID=UPI000651B5C1|nr:hypothetical protein SL11_05331 [Klebsiella pneumoniae]